MIGPAATVGEMSPRTPSPTTSVRGAERRKHCRMAYHTAVTAFVADNESLEVNRCWLSDISATGARVHSSQPFAARQLFLRILMDGLQGRIVLAEIANTRLQPSDPIGDRRRLQYIYGVRFKSFVSDASILDRLHSALAVTR